VERQDRSHALLRNNIHQHAKWGTTKKHKRLEKMKTAIMLGQQIVVHADHKNTTHEVLNTERVMCWHLTVKEHGLDLCCVKGECIIAADTLSWWQLEPSQKGKCDEMAHEAPTVHELAKAFGFEEESADGTFPLNHKQI
jgi:hypothetical protein